MPIIWDKTFSVGIESIDSQHKKLIAIFNELNAALQDGSSFDKMDVIFSKIVDYTIEHFAYEEELFDKYNYPDTENHKRKHQYIIDEIEVMKKKDPNKSIVSLELVTFLRKWLQKHILRSDKAYSAFLIKKGVV